MRLFSSVPVIHVGLDFGAGKIPVGRLALKDRRIYFAYDVSFLGMRLEISPFTLPVKAEVQSFDNHLFEGLPGVFNDSLPDGWGRLLFDRLALTQGILPTEVTPLDRLASVGSHALGALVYEPEYEITATTRSVDLDLVASQVQEVLKGTSEEILQRLLALNGSSAGASPKALIGVSHDHKHVIFGKKDFDTAYEPYLVKFPNTQDGIDSGAIEYVYALMAKEAGIAMPDVHLFSAKDGPGYFAARRFDCEGTRRYHMHSVSGLLHADFRVPSLDY